MVAAIQKARPNVYWENCENGGNMMTFNMVKHYVTSVTNDASGSLPSRHAVFGATYPFLAALCRPVYAVERWRVELLGPQLHVRWKLGADDATCLP